MRRPLIAALAVIVACAPPQVRFSPPPNIGVAATNAPAATFAEAGVVPTPEPAAPGVGSAATAPSPAAVQLSAPTGNVVWALVAGSRLFRSIDRGNTWEQRGLPAGVAVSYLSFLDEREGWILSTSPATAGCATQRFTVFHTVDRGVSWQRVSQSDAADPACKLGVTFADPQRGWIPLAAQGAPPSLLRTTDSGETWTRSFNVPTPPGHRFATNAPPAIGRAYVFGAILLFYAFATNTRDGGQYASAFFSGTNGLTFVVRGTAPEQAAPIYFASATRWLSVGPSAKWYETTNGGSSWHEFFTDYKQAAPAAPDLLFGDPNIGYAAFRGVVQRTTDGGGHWETIKTPGA